MANFPLWADHILALLFGIALPFYSAFRKPKDLSGMHFESYQKKHLYLTNSISLFLMALVILVVWFLFKRPFAEIGFKQVSNINSWWGLVLVFILLYLTDTVKAISSKEEIEEKFKAQISKTPFMPTKKAELPLYFLMCFSAGVFEEIIFRGFLVTYCYFLFFEFVNGDQWAVILPAIVFSIAHYYQGGKAVVKIFILSLLFGFIFLWSGSLIVVMLLHFTVDAIGGLLTMKYQNEE